MISTELPIQTNSELQTRSEDATPRGLGVMCDFYVARAENAELWDVEGRRFIDFSSGISVNNVGHRHPIPPPEPLGARRDSVTGSLEKISVMTPRPT